MDTNTYVMSDKNAEPLNERELYCLAKHLQIFYLKAFLHGENVEHESGLPACGNCPHFHCVKETVEGDRVKLNCEYSGHRFFYGLLKRLEDLTDVSFPPLIGFDPLMPASVYRKSNVS